MRITAIDISRHRLPLDPPFRASWDSKPRTAFEATIVRVHTDAGLTGVGSGDTMTGFAGHEALFVGEDPMAIERHWRILDNLQFHYGRYWPLDIALWDLVGKITGQPCFRLIGGRADAVPAYASLGARHPPETIPDLAARLNETGFAAVKFRLHGLDARTAIRSLEALRAGLAADRTILVDCNQGWRMPWDAYDPWTFKDALGLARELERLGVYWMEEPLHRADRAGMRRLREATDIRIAGGEMTRELDAFRDLLVEGCLDVVQPDAALVGGITGLRRVAMLAESFGVTFSPHTWTNGMGLIANAHLVCGLGPPPFLEVPFDPPEWTPGRRDFMLAEPVEIGADGLLRLPDAAGMGYRLNEDLLARTRIG